jgi:hypothetical protein
MRLTKLKYAVTQAALWIASSENPVWSGNCICLKRRGSSRYDGHWR